ncbi:EAL domain-containing protein [Enterobacter cloacae]|uniref:EAL domain-containing protein n=1 Tax=Enterobacter cloacae TaxID=550 RepID=UPI000B8CD4E3|nr:cyclic diguanylate phosphodiesterase [Enterobacter cloacae]OXU34842.1 diguanylate phosphodiesterase [Enterobacter cloacae subsp. cloacae]
MKRRSNNILAVSILVPSLLCLLLSVGMAVYQLKRDTAVTADILLRQVDRVTGIAIQASLIAAEMADRPCDEIREKITATGTLTPYVRSTGLIRNDSLVCSSLNGSQVQKVRDVYGTEITSRKSAVNIFTIIGTRNIPGQKVVIYATRAANGMTAFSVVDARYFIDLMDSLDDENNSISHLQFSSGPIISWPEKFVAEYLSFRSYFRSSFSQVSLKVDIPYQSLGYYVLRNLLFLAPLFLILLYAWRRWRPHNMSLADEIKKGIHYGEFSVNYQPICETISGKCVGVEALMRWQRRDGGSISPAVFIPAAEENGMIVTLTQHLFTLITRDVKSWDVTAPFHIGVNIAASHLAHPSFTNDILRLWVALDLTFTLVLEITERSLVEDTAVASEKLNVLRQRGCQVAVDDFGTGYCSLSLLQKLPVDYLKIDKSFIDTLTSAGADTPILDTIVALSQRLDLATIAEGISTPHQVEWLKTNKVQYVQGYFFSKPIPADEFQQWYAGNQSMTTGKRKPIESEET